VFAAYAFFDREGEWRVSLPGLRKGQSLILYLRPVGGCALQRVCLVPSDWHGCLMMRVCLLLCICTCTPYDAGFVAAHMYMYARTNVSVRLTSMAVGLRRRLRPRPPRPPTPRGPRSRARGMPAPRCRSVAAVRTPPRSHQPPPALPPPHFHLETNWMRAGMPAPIVPLRRALAAAHHTACSHQSGRSFDVQVAVPLAVPANRWLA